MPPNQDHNITRRRLTKTIVLTFNTNDTYNVYINIPYEVEHVILKTASKASFDYTNDESITLLTCGLFKEPLFVNAKDSVAVDPDGLNTTNYARTSNYQNMNLYHEITNNSINSNYEFVLRSSDYSKISNIDTIETIIVLQLEFVEKI